MLVIHAKGNEKIGIGNLARCFELASYLNNFINCKALFECEEELFSRFKAPFCIHSDSKEKSLEILEDLSKLGMKYYLSDLLDADSLLSNYLKNIGVKLIFQLGEIPNDFKADILIVGNSFDYEIKIPNNSPNLKIYKDFKYYIISQEIASKRPLNFTPTKEIKNILLSFGGSDPAKFSEYFSEILDENDGKSYSLILGPAMSEKRKNLIKKTKKSNLKFLDSPSGLSEILPKFDLLVTLGGMTTYEAMTLGVLASAIEWEYLAFCVKGFESKNLITNLGDIKNAYKNLLNLDINLANKRAQNAFNTIDGKALKYIKNVILEEIQNNQKLADL